MCCLGTSDKTDCGITSPLVILPAISLSTTCHAGPTCSSIPFASSTAASTNRVSRHYSACTLPSSTATVTAWRLRWSKAEGVIVAFRSAKDAFAWRRNKTAFSKWLHSTRQTAHPIAIQQASTRSTNLRDACLFKANRG